MFIKKYTKISPILIFLVIMFSCKNLEDLNINPNGVDPASGHPNLLMSTVITGVAQTVVNLGYGDLAGVMQHTQKDGWGGSHNGYEWSGRSWSGYYGILRNNDEMYNKAVEAGLEFHQGVALIMKSYVFGLITDLWGDAPYSQALKGEQGGEANLKPVFDNQEDIYAGILSDLEKANTLLAKGQDAYTDISSIQDPLYGGDVVKWRKFANSLALRYYMRISEKDPSTAQAGIEKIAGSFDTYPLLLSANEDAAVAYPGTGSIDSWPANTVYDGTGGSNYRRLKMCSVLVDTMQKNNDPRLALWANKIAIPIVVDSTLEDDADIIENGIRRIAPNVANEYIGLYGFGIDSDPQYVGLPPAWSQVPQAYNLNPNLEQAPNNPHVSHLNDRYKEPSGDLLKSRMLSSAEVRFILAEAALKGWNVGGSAQEYYEAGIQNALDAWGVGDQYQSYIVGKDVAFNGTLAQIMEQKWVASWTAAAEAWFDFRRTGLPALVPGVASERVVLPVRFAYSQNELDFNPVNANTAIGRLESTPYGDGNNEWAKMWVLQGTGKPW